MAAHGCGRLDLDQRRSTARSCSRSSIASAGAPGAGHARPAPPSAAAGSCSCLVLRDAARDRAHDVQRVEARHPRTRLTDVDARIRQPQPLGRRADGEAQQQALGCAARLLLDQARAERRAHLVVEHQRIFVRAAAGTSARRARGRRRRGTSGRAPAAGRRRTRGRTAIAADRSSSMPSRSAMTSRASSSDTGPMSAIGRSCSRPRSTRSGCDSTIGASAAKRSSHSPHVADRRPRGQRVDRPAARRRAGARGCAGRVRCARRMASRDRRAARRRAGRAVRWRTRRAAGATAPGRRRSRPTRRSTFPISRRAQRALDHDGSSVSDVGVRVLRRRPRSRRVDRGRDGVSDPASIRASERPRRRGSTNAELAAASSGAAPDRATGIRRTGAPTASRTAQARMARNARPAGCGRRVPRSNQRAGTSSGARGTRARAARRSAPARAGTRPSRRTARRAPPPRGSGARSRRTRVLRRAPRRS